MANLNKIAEDIAYKLGDQFNHTLKESIKHTVIVYRSKFMRDDIDRNGSNVNSYYQTLTVGFEKVNILEDLDAELECLSDLCSDAKEDEKFYILKSKFKIPSFIRLKNNSSSPFRYIGSLTRKTRFKPGTPETIQFLQELKYRKNITYYYFSNNYLYLFTESYELATICEGLIDGIFDDPTQVFDVCKGDTFRDDRDFPISNDLLFYIIDGIVTRSYPLIIKGDGEQINLQQNNRRNDKNSSPV